MEFWHRRCPLLGIILPVFLPFQLSSLKVIRPCCGGGLRWLCVNSGLNCNKPLGWFNLSILELFLPSHCKFTGNSTLLFLLPPLICSRSAVLGTQSVVRHPQKPSSSSSLLYQLLFLPLSSPSSHVPRPKATAGVHLRPSSLLLCHTDVCTRRQKHLPPLDISSLWKCWSVPQAVSGCGTSWKVLVGLHLPQTFKWQMAKTSRRSTS